MSLFSRFKEEFDKVDQNVDLSTDKCEIQTFTIDDQYKWQRIQPIDDNTKEGIQIVVDLKNKKRFFATFSLAKAIDKIKEWKNEQRKRAIN